VQPYKGSESEFNLVERLYGKEAAGVGCALLKARIHLAKLPGTKSAITVEYRETQNPKNKRGGNSQKERIRVQL